jgi:hypothetical protein
MKNLIIVIIIFVLGFILGAGAGFKILQGFSTDLVIEAFQNSAQGFTEAYSGSAVQEAVQGQKDALETQVKNSILEYVKGKLGMGTGN